MAACDSDAEARFLAARTVLARHFGFPEFRARQERVVRSVLAGRDTLAVLPTGAGKSACFQVPAMIADGLTLVISPLVALMQDQVGAALARGIPARCLNSLQPAAEQAEVLREVGAGEVRLLYVAPERSRKLVGELRDGGARVALLAVDEAHCLAEWGPDFRPAFLRLGWLREALGWPPCVALTGTATPAVRTAIAAGLGLGRRGGYDLHVASFDRRNLWFGVAPVRSERERLRRLVELLRFDDRIAIVYAPTRNLTEGLARVLVEQGLRAAAFHAGLTRGRRRQVLDDFLDDRLEVVTATCAFGLGIDKPNVRLVVHWAMPPTPEAYYQEAGRAGRDGGPARCVLLYRPGDHVRPLRQLAGSFPDRKLVERAIRDPAVRAGLPAGVGAAVDRLTREVRAGAAGWRRIAARRKAAEERIAAVRAYAESRRCRRDVLLRYFGERLVRCSGCDRCARPAPPAADPAVRERVRRIAAVARGLTGPWNGELVDAALMRRLAEHPPVDAAALAATPGVGPELASRIARPLLEALGSLAPAVPPDAPPLAASPRGAGPDLRQRLARWRARRARELGVADWRVADDRLLDQLAERRPRTRRELAACAGVGPRFLAAEAESLLRELSADGVASPPDCGSAPVGAEAGIWTASVGERYT